MTGVDPRVASQGDHDERHARVDGRLEGPEVGVTGSGQRVDDPGGEVGVAGHPAQSGEMLGGGGHSGLPHPAEERHAVRRHGLRVAAILAPQRADRLVPRGGPGRDHVHDRGQVKVDAGLPQLASPPGGLPLQRAGGQLALGHGRRDRREARPSQPLDLAAFLVGGDEEPDPRGGARGGQRLVGRCHLPESGQAGRCRGAEHQRAEVIGRDRAGDRGTGGVGDTDHKQLPCPLGHGHPGEDPGRAGERLAGLRRPRRLRGRGARGAGRRRGAGCPGCRVTARGGVASRTGQSQRENAADQSAGYLVPDHATGFPAGNVADPARYHRSARSGRERR